MAVMAIIFTLLTQADKLAVSRMMPLEMLGYYTLAVALASVPTMLAGPIAMAVFPRLTALATLGDRDGLAALFNRTSSLISLATIPAGITLAFLATEFIFAWTGSHTIAREAGIVASLLLAGQMLQALQIVPYHFSLAHGNVRINLINGVCSVLFITPILVLLIGRFGLVGAGMSWLILNVCALPIYMHFFKRSFGMGDVLPWLTRYLLIPVLATLPIAALGYWLAPETASRLLVVGYIGFVWASSFALNIFLNPELRRLVGHQLKLTASKA
jgi:O-antigen/teichoic acid export membrane protein